MAHYDWVIRRGTIVDGTGQKPYEADVAFDADKIVAVGTIAQSGRQEIDARGKLVTPGFVDIHTHYDGQAVWSSRLSPSSAHGVTTAIMGNCGVGFAPCRPDDREQLIELMEGVEDIPEVVMTEGLTWEWETFPEYLETLASRSFDIDIGAQLPHSALRLYVMGSRAVARQPSTEQDNARMAELAFEAMRAGAIGFGTSRTLQHRTGQGENIPTYGTSEAELTSIALGMARAGHGVIELAMDLTDIENEMVLLRNIARASGLPITFGLAQLPSQPDSWRVALEFAAGMNDDAVSLRAQVTPRGIGMLMGHELSCHPFSFSPTYRQLERLDFEEKTAALRQPHIRDRILSEPPSKEGTPALERVRPRLRRFDDIFPFREPSYEPDKGTALSRLAREKGVSPEALAYDYMLENDGKGMLYLPSGNYVDYSLDVVYEMLTDPHCVLGLGDGGAHCGSICDASFPTFVLSYWTRDREGRRIPLQDAVRSLTAVSADAAGLRDRGIIAAGYRADVNIIDYEKLELGMPRVVYDFPAGGRRLIQDSTGYDATFVSGHMTYAHGEPTQALPGRLLRGPRPAPKPAF